MENPIDALPKDLRKKLRRRKQPEWTQPMLATLVDELLERLAGRMKKMERDAPPFSVEDLPEKSFHWIEPELVGEV